MKNEVNQWDRLVAAEPGKGLRFLYLFSGPDDRPDGINTYCAQLGAVVDCYDKRYLDQQKHDLCDEDNWQQKCTTLLGSTGLSGCEVHTVDVPRRRQWTQDK